MSKMRVTAALVRAQFKRIVLGEVVIDPRAEFIVFLRIVE
jgi:hypothetical protein